jgi:hypothetical protein
LFAHTRLLIDVRKWLAVTRVINVPSRVDEESLSAIRLASTGHDVRDNGRGLTGRTSSFLALDWRAQKLLVTSEGTEGFCSSRYPSTYCSNERMLEKFINIGLNVAARLPIIDGPCGCHPP